MSAQAEMGERHGRMLARLAELGMSLAERLHADALSADTPAEAADAAKAFHTVSRTVRQSVALEARLHREAQAGEASCRVQTERRIFQRREGVYSAAMRLIRQEIDPSEDELPDWELAAAETALGLSQEEGFLERSMPDLMARTRAILGVDEIVELEDGDAESAEDTPDEDPGDDETPSHEDDADDAGPHHPPDLTASRRGWPPSPADEGWAEFFRDRRESG